MAEIVDDRDAADFAAYGEAPRDTFELRDRFGVRVERNREEVGYGEHAECVEHVVRARHRQRDFTELVGAAPRDKPRDETFVANVTRAIGRLIRNAERR